MARPKDKTGPSLMTTHGKERSVAFENRAKQELEKLSLKVAKVLTDDFLSVCDHGDHSDLTITNGMCEVKAHRCIFQARARHLWQEDWITPEAEVEGNNRWKIVMNGLTEKQISDFVRQLYTVSDSALLMEEFLPNFPNHRDNRIITTEDEAQSNTDEEKDTVLNEESVANGDESDSNPCCNHHVTGRDNDSFTDVDTGGNGVDIVRGKDVSSCQTSIHDEGDGGRGMFLKETISLHTEEQNGLDTSIKREENIQTGICDDSCAGLKNGGVFVSESVNSEHHSENEMLCLVNGKDNCEIMCEKVDVNCEACDGKEYEQIEKTNDSVSIVGVTNTTNHEEDGSFSLDNFRLDTCVQKSEILSNCVQENTQIQRSGDTLTESSTVIVQSDLSEAIKKSYSLSIPYETCSHLGRDLLQMYLQQANCDICLCVDGVRFLAHKCVLATRSSYFGAMLGGKWCESEMEEIELQGVSAQALEQLLLFLYGGVMELCTPCDLMELFIIVDMYGVDTLKLVLQFYIRKDLCHFFHKPCSTCIVGASSALNLCHIFLLEDLEERCLKWTVKHFIKIWSNKAFASLPEVIHQKCAQSMLGSMTEKSVLDIIMECNKLSTSLPRIKWTESILYLATQLMDSAIEYTSSNFIKVIRTSEFLQWGKVAAWKAGALEEIFNSVIDSLPIESACSAYQTLVDLKAYQASLEVNDQDVLDLLDTMVKRCEKFLRTHIHQVARSKQWMSIGKSLQSQILENSSYIHLDQLPEPKSRPFKRPLPTRSRSKSPASSSSRPAGSSRIINRNRPIPTSTTVRQSKMSQNSTTVKHQSSTVPSQVLPKQKKSKSSLLSSSPTSASLSSSSLNPKATTKGSSLTKTLSTSPKYTLSSSPKNVHTELGMKSVKANDTKIISSSPSYLRRSISPASRIPVQTSGNKKMEKEIPQNINCSNEEAIAIIEVDVNNCKPAEREGDESVRGSRLTSGVQDLSSEVRGGDDRVNNPYRSSYGEDTRIVTGADNYELENVQDGTENDNTVCELCNGRGGYDEEVKSKSCIGYGGICWNGVDGVSVNIVCCDNNCSSTSSAGTGGQNCKRDEEEYGQSHVVGVGEQELDHHSTVLSECSSVEVVSRVDTTGSGVCVKQQTNFVKKPPSVKIEFIVPED